MPKNEEFERAEQGDTIAQFELGYSYKRERNYKEAIKWFTKSANQGDIGSQNFLGDIYRDEYNDTEKSIYWYTQAAEQGSIYSKRKLRNIYYKMKNSEKAIYWAKKINENDMNEDDFFVRGMSYWRLNNYEEAMYWLKKGAELGYATCELGIGIMYEFGTGVNGSYDEALFWYEKAANRGYEKQAVELIEKLYYKGYVGYDKVVYWIRHAADMGYDWAIDKLNNF